MQHFLQSLFNLRIPDWMAKVSPTEQRDWCTHRARLFLDITLPSVLGQSSPEFEWLIYFDVERNEPVEEVLDVVASHRNIHPVFYDCRDRHPGELAGQVRIDVAARTSPDTALVLTTKLDTDDALHRDFVRVLHHHARELSPDELHSGLALNFDYGAQLVDGRFFAYLYGSNPFLTMVDPVRSADGSALCFDRLKTAMTMMHYKIQESVPVKHVLHNQPLWLQAIHDRNAYNKARIGLLEFADPGKVGAMFGVTPEALGRLTQRATVGDRSIRPPSP